MTKSDLEDRRLEYELLREEIRYNDRVCLTVIGALLAGSTALMPTIINDTTPKWLILTLSISWFIGYLYCTEKRFMILRIACYLYKEVEQSSGGFNWERWLRQQPKRFEKIYPRIDPYWIESVVFLFALASLVLLSDPGLLDRPVHETLLRAGFSFWATLIFLIVGVSVVVLTLRRYQEALLAQHC